MNQIFWSELQNQSSLMEDVRRLWSEKGHLKPDEENYMPGHSESEIDYMLQRPTSAMIEKLDKVKILISPVKCSPSAMLLLAAYPAKAFEPQPEEET